MCDISGSGCLVCFDIVMHLFCTIKIVTTAASGSFGAVDTDGTDGLQTLLKLANRFNSTVLTALMVLMVSTWATDGY
jgi:hypothetical protein